VAAQIENYLGFPAGISGAELADRAVVRARKFGATFTIPGEAQSLDRIHGHFVVGLTDGALVEAHPVRATHPVAQGRDRARRQGFVLSGASVEAA
jgi:thioredoxin reductase (NADPH)